MKNNRPGFTLVELLVVIAIIGILMGLLIPAVNAARETARRNQCSTYIKNFSLAAIQYENTKGQLPGYLQSYGNFVGGVVDPSNPTGGTVPAHVKLGTWVVSLMPWLDAQPTYEIWTEDRYPVIDNASTPEFSDTSSPNLAIMQCPSNPNDQAEQARNSYISNNGMYPSLGTTAVVTFLESMDRSNGAFNNKFAGSSASSAEVGAKVRLADMKDGQGNTVLFSENVQSLPWNALGLLANGGAPSLNGTTAASPPGYPPSSRYSQGMVWFYEDPEPTATYPWSHGTPGAVKAKHKINGRGTLASEAIFTEEMKAPVGTTIAADLARPSSAHVDGVNTGMADGGTRYITNSIDYRVYQALLTPRGKSSDVPWQEYVLDDGAI